MKRKLLFVIFIALCHNAFSQTKNNLNIGIGASWMSDVVLKRGYRLDVEYNRRLKGRLGIAVNVNTNYASGVGFGFAVNPPADSGYLLVGQGIKPILPGMNTIKRYPINPLNAHTWQVFNMNLQLNATFDLLLKPNDNFYIIGGLVFNYSSQTLIQADVLVLDGKYFSSLNLPKGGFKALVPNYARYYDIALNVGAKYVHYFKNNFSVGLRGGLEFSQVWGIFSFSAICGVRF